MAARFHALDHQGVDARADQLLGQREGRGEADEFRPALLDPVDRARWGEAAGEDDMPDVVLLADVDQFHALGMHGDEVDAEGPGRPLLRSDEHTSELQSLMIAAYVG